ncbi:transketolase [[Eubacterium] cellulosolvens]
MSHNEKLIKDLEEKAKTLRRHAISMIKNAGMGWIGGSFSETEIITCLLFHHMKHDPKKPDWPERDRLILSKAHCCEMLYAALGEAGYFSKEHFNSYGKFGALLQAHTQTTTPGVEYSGGSLGTGLSFAVGEALATKIDRFGKGPDSKGFNVYCILGDGECDEGQVWEAALSASNFELDNLTAIIDRNDYQSTGKVVDIMRLEPFAEKWRVFSWHVIDIDGHDIVQIIDALNEANRTPNKPTAIIAHTIKGKGVPSFEERRLHFTKITDDMYSEAMEALK